MRVGACHEARVGTDRGLQVEFSSAANRCRVCTIGTPPERAGRGRLELPLVAAFSDFTSALHKRVAEVLRQRFGRRVTLERADAELQLDPDCEDVTSCPTLNRARAGLRIHRLQDCAGARSRPVLRRRRRRLSIGFRSAMTTPKARQLPEVQAALGGRCNRHVARLFPAEVVRERGQSAADGLIRELDLARALGIAPAFHPSPGDA